MRGGKDSPYPRTVCSALANWMLPNETKRKPSDPLVRKLGIIAAVCAVLMVLLFVVYKIVLSSGVHVA